MFQHRRVIWAMQLFQRDLSVNLSRKHNYIIYWEFWVLYTAMRLKNFHMLITFCLDSLETLTSKGPFSQVLSGYLQFNYLWYDCTAFLFVCVCLFLECFLPVCFTVLCFMYVYAVYFYCILFSCCLTWRNKEWSFVEISRQIWRISTDLLV